MITHNDFRKKWADFMEQHGHQLVPPVPLPSYSDPTLLFVNSGMFPLVSYLEGEQHPLGKRLYNIQRAIRPMEFEQIGDNRHTSVFEMIGNWSLGDYFKETQLKNLYSFLIEDLGLEPDRLYASVFAGDKDAPRDKESINILKDIFSKYGIKAKIAPDDYDRICDKESIDLDKYRIFPFRKEVNWWKRGDAIGELGGPDCEVFYDLRIDHDSSKWGYPHPATDSGRFIELGNSVFMQYKKTAKGWELLKQKNVDFGGGFERIVMVLQDKTDIFSTDIYTPAIKRLEEISKIKYEPDESNISPEIKAFRVIVDHIKGALFMIADGVEPSNKEQGYVLRRAIRRALLFARDLNIEKGFAKYVAEGLIESYSKAYPHAVARSEQVIQILADEETRFNNVIDKATKEFKKVSKDKNDSELGDIAFNFLQTYGMPAEIFLESLERIKKVDQDKFWSAFKKAQQEHQVKSRKGSEKRFKGGLADTKEKTIRYHSCAHLLLAALQEVLGNDIHQKGQNITDERLRFDFNFPRPLTDKEILQIESIVNRNIQAGLVVSVEQHRKDEIESIGAEASFLERYPDTITVYKFTDPATNEVISYEVCGGPHVKNTSEIAKEGHFKIVKEKSSSAGIRRIRGELVKN